MRPLLSIVVPTRNRQNCGLSLVKGLHASEARNFKLVLHDNSDNDSLGAAVAELGDPRLRYSHTSDKLNMHGNFDRAIKQAKGVYVCGLGDDDGILVEPALALLQTALDRDIDAVLPGIHSYSWPDLRRWYWGDVGGRLFPSVTPAHERLLDPETELAAVFACGVTRGLGLLPRAYQGIVSRRSLDVVKARCGTYFPGPSPDMANAVALAATVRSIWLHPKPVIISGHSPKSGGGAGAAGQHHGRLEDQPHLPAGTIEAWTPAIPRFWSGFTIYAQSAQMAAIQSRSAPPPRLGLTKLYATCLVFERRVYWPEVWKAMRRNADFGPGLMLRVAGTTIVMLAQRTRSFIASFFRYRFDRGDPRRFTDVEDLMRVLREERGVTDQPSPTR